MAERPEWAACRALADDEAEHVAEVEGREMLALLDRRGGAGWSGADEARLRTLVERRQVAAELDPGTPGDRETLQRMIDELEPRRG